MIDETLTKTFFEKVLQPLQDDEVYILLLNARKKYYPEIRSEEVVDRAIIRDNDINKIIRKIKKLSQVSGIYEDRATHKDIPEQAFALYIGLNPKSTLKAYSTFQKDINDWCYPNLKGAEKDLTLFRKIDLKLISAIHRSSSRRLYTIIDIDKKDEQTLNDIITLLANHIKWISETHGGYHIIVEKNNESGRIIYTQIKGMDKIEILKESLTPIPGTLQGGFLVKAIPLNKS